ncbi:chain length determinant protein EpsF [Pseudorhodoferax soli]|uniref:Chain length determinant protein EpsF n=1 Tax=Pseudorhodoferax soli TaxID=545864 RepID=A0A368Y9E7_9BURK|nr:chain length determinant protein EpsF [Pseudorhodoferax soli]RCW76048.1 chain length determinant protein EpsF [Pseudorhodoferax soli]
MRLAEIFVLLRARWKLAALVWVTVVALVAAVTLLKEPKYTATASVVLDVKSPDPIAGVILPGMANSSYMGTQLGVVRSDRVALRVAQALGWDKDEERRKRWLEANEGRGDFSAALAGSLLRDMEALATRDSNVITVAYTSSDSLRAAQIANAWVKAYIDTTLELRVDPARQYSGFFDTYGKQLREDLERAQAKLSAYQREHGLVATDERVDVENLRLVELSSQLVALQGVANETGGRQSQAVANADRMPEVLSNPVIVNLTAELGRQEARNKELGERLGERHPEMLELKAKIADLRATIDAETRRVTGSITVTNNVNQARLEQLRAAVEEQRARLLQLRALRDEAGVLQRDVENARRAYDTIMARVSQTNIESQSTQTNVSVLKEATEPTSPSEPRVVLNMAVAVLAATLLAMAAALGTEMRDRRLRTEQDVLRGLHLPLLGTMPDRTRRPVRSVGWTAQIAGGTPTQRQSN